MVSGSVITGRFELERIAGKGGMGAVYRALDRTSGATVALKRVRAPDVETTRRFEQEAGLLAQLRHPGIVRYVDHGTTEDGDLYLAMEWLEGEDLANRLRRERLSFEDAVRMVTRVAETLGAAHELGIVHRDIKPGNLFLVGCDPTTPKLLDFGIALTRRSVAERFTAQGAAPGTPGYMAPEQLDSHGSVDARADVYGLGCVLFKCVAGRTPFVAKDPMALLMKAALDTPPSLREVSSDAPDELVDLVDRMLARDPGARFADGSELAAALSDLPPISPWGHGRVSRPVPELTELERRLVSVVLAARAVSPTADDTIVDASARGEPATRASTKMAPGWVEQRIVALGGQFGGRVGTLLDGSVVVLLRASGSAQDLVRRAARCALAIQQLVPQAPVALSTARVAPTANLLDEAADRAAALLRLAPSDGPREVRVDEITAGLLGSSFDVAGDHDGLWLLGVAEASAAAPTVLGRATPCVGRARELSMLRAIWDECVDEPHAATVLITGAAGMGKSRVLHEHLRVLEERGAPFELLSARGDAISAGSPFGMLANLVRRAAQLPEDEAPDVTAMKLRARVGRHVREEELDRVAGFLSVLVGAEPESSGRADLGAAREDPMLMGDQIRRAFGDFVEAETGAGPVLLVLDDLSWGDLPSIRTVQNALRRLRERPLMVLALARPEVHAAFPSLTQGPPLTELQLGPLSAKASERLARDVLGSHVADDEVLAIVEQAGGHALYLEEIVRALAQGRRRFDTVLLMVQARLEEIEGEARRILRAGSVFGQVFWAGGVSALLGGSERTARIEDWLAELVERELIVARPRSRFQKDEEFAFRHSLARDAAYGMLTKEDRELGHRLAAAWLERSGEKDVISLAEHHERGADPPGAIRWWVAAATQALEGNDFESAIECGERGARAGASGQALGELRLVQARARRWSGSNAEAERYGRVAMGVLSPGSAGYFDAVAEVVQAVGRQGGRVNALVALAETIERVDAVGDAERRKQIAAARSVVHLLHADRRELADRLLGLARRGVDPTAQAFAFVASGSTALSDGDPSLAVRCSRDAIRAFESIGDLRDACMQRVNLGFASMEVGDYAVAASELRSATATAERMGLDDARAIAQQNLAMTLCMTGELEEAQALAEESIEAFQRQNNQLMLGASKTYLAQIFEQRGELDEAARIGGEAVADLREFGVRGHALAVLARVLRRKGQPGPALAVARDAMSVVDEHGTVEEGEGKIHLELAEALHAVGESEEAREVIERARRRLLERAAKISDGERRADFLTRVPEHARTVILAEGGFDES